MPVKILVINGPSLNMLGIREPEIYGNGTYAELEKCIRDFCREHGAECDIFQSNHEGDIIDKICASYKDADAIIINAGAYTHTSIAIMDAIRAVNIRAVEVHLSDISAREDFRKVSYVGMACEKCFSGRGFDSYTDALQYLICS